MNTQTQSENGVGRSAHDTPKVQRVFWSRRVGPWLLVSLEQPELPAKPNRSCPA